MSSTPLFPGGIGRALLLGQWTQLLHRSRLLLMLIAAVAIVTVVAGITGRSEDALKLAAGLSSFAPFALGLSLMSGVVSDDLRSGTILLWYQQPGALSGFYLRRVAQRLLLIAALTALLAVLASVVCVVWAAMRPAKVPMVLVQALVYAALAVSFTFDHSMLGRTMRALAFPIDPLEVIAKGGGAYSVPVAWGIIAAQLLGWTMIGITGLLVLPRRLATTMTDE
jgi:hypothetical protein